MIEIQLGAHPVVIIIIGTIAIVGFISIMFLGAFFIKKRYDYKTDKKLNEATNYKKRTNGVHTDADNIKI